MWIFAITVGAGLAAYAAFVMWGRMSESQKRADPEKVWKLGRKKSMAASPPDIGNYEDYSMTSADRWISGFAAGAVLFVLGFLFYKNVWICLTIAMFAIVYPKLRKVQLIRKRKEELRRQFKHALYSLSSALSAGKSVENAFRETANDLILLYPDHQTDMIRELNRINRRTENGEPIERSLLDLGRRSGIEDVMQFAESFAACKRTGGDLVEVMRRTSNLIGEKMDIEQDLSVMIAQKRFEAKALGFIPFVIVAFLAFSSPDYMQPLYEGAGHLIMTAALLILAASQWLARRIMNIGM